MLHQYGWTLPVVLAIILVYATSFITYKIDLTAEKRFTLSKSTRYLLQQIDSTVLIDVYLTGNLPSDYKKLSIATKDLLDEMKDVNHLIQVRMIEPEPEWADSVKLNWYDSLAQLGVVFEQTEEGTVSQKETKIIIPSAIVQYQNKKPYAIDLRSSKTIFKNYNVINDIPEVDKEATRNAAEALLEFKFANAIEKLTRKYIPVIAYVVGNGEPVDERVNDLGESLRNNYRLGVFNLKAAYPQADAIDALIIVKPSQPFNEEDKLKIDQYIMHGGKVLWCIDKLYAEIDSLMRSQADFIAFDRNLNLDDILFKYGVRINGDLVQDLNCSKIPIVVGYNPDHSPRIQRMPWPYYPFLSSINNNPVSKNLDRVLPLFPSSIDTVKAAGIQKTILLATDTNSRTLASPALVSLNSVQTEEDFQSFTRSHIPVAVLLEGKFHSLFANRLSGSIKDSVKRASGKAFIAEGLKESKQIVLSDADIVTNMVSPSAGPLPMGMLPMENYQFANREFFLNSIDYLVTNHNLLEARNKNITLRLLDKEKLNKQKNRWQWLNVLVPVGTILAFGIMFQWYQRRLFTKKYN